MDGVPASGKGLPSIGDEIAGKYRVETVIGQGGMGAVYSARNLMTGKRVALKWLLPEHAASSTRERLLREARIACSVDHPNVVDIYDVGEDQGGLFLVMEYLRGQPLSDVLAERGRLDPEELIALLVPTMRGVHAAHQAGVIHRDLKPENIILSESDGEIIPKVVDFGVSKTVGASSVPHSSLTRTGALVGTPHYMALEQVDGSNQIDARTDVYAFGVLLYRALTGHYPFDGSSLGEVILKIGTKDALPLRSLRPELPVELEAAVMRALFRNRDLRFRDLEELAAALEPFSPGVRFHRDPGLSRSNAGPSRERLLTPNLHTPSGGGPVPAFGDVYREGDTVSVASLRQTPAKPEQRLRPAPAFWIGAGAAFLVLIAVISWIFQGEGAAPSDPAQVAHGVPTSAEPVSIASPPAAGPVEIEAEDTVPAQAAALNPSNVAVDGAVEFVDGVEVQAEAQAVEPPVEAAPVQIKRGRRRQEGHGAPQRIPGERTKGLSVDDF